MLDAARLAIRFARDRGRIDLDRDPEMLLAMLKAVQIIREAALEQFRVIAEELGQSAHWVERP